MAVLDVDLVYTWVNDGDPELARLRCETASAEVRSDVAYRAGSSRIEDHGELRCSILTAERYCPFFRRIYIFGAGQPPAWLQSFGERVVYIDQDAILPASIKPMFQSDAVEAFISRIPGLSEHYVYSNDDCFFSAQHTPADFFSADGLRVGVSNYPMIAGGKPAVYRDMEINAACALKKHTKVRPWVPVSPGLRGRLRPRLRMAMAKQRLPLLNATTHVAKPFLKSSWDGFRELFDHELTQLLSKKFRSRQGFTVNLAYHHYMRSIGKASFYLAPSHRLINRSDGRACWEALKGDIEKEDGTVTRFCLNDGPVDNEDGWAAFVSGLLGLIESRMIGKRPRKPLAAGHKNTDSQLSPIQHVCSNL